jgi:hypothetical protein
VHVVTPGGDQERPPPPQITVARTVVEQLNAGVRWLVLMVVAMGLLFAYDAWQDGKKDHRQDEISKHLVASDIELSNTSDRLQDLIDAEAREDEVDEATQCVQNHVGYGYVKALLEKIGKATYLTNDQVTDLLATFPAPVCDLDAAQQVLADP